MSYCEALAFLLRATTYASTRTATPLNRTRKEILSTFGGELFSRAPGGIAQQRMDLCKTSPDGSPFAPGVSLTQDALRRGSSAPTSGSAAEVPLDLAAFFSVLDPDIAVVAGCQRLPQGKRQPDFRVVGR